MSERERELIMPTSGYKSLREARQKMKKIRDERQAIQELLPKTVDVLGSMSLQKEDVAGAWKHYEEGISALGYEIPERDDNFLSETIGKYIMPKGSVVFDNKEYNKEQIIRLGEQIANISDLKESFNEGQYKGLLDIWKSQVEYKAIDEKEDE